MTFTSPDQQSVEIDIDGTKFRTSRAAVADLLERSCANGTAKIYSFSAAELESPSQPA
jgi:hypothetical protein